MVMMVNTIQSSGDGAQRPVKRPDSSCVGTGTQSLPTIGTIFNGLVNGSVPQTVVSGVAAVPATNVTDGRCMRPALI